MAADAACGNASACMVVFLVTVGAEFATSDNVAEKILATEPEDVGLRPSCGIFSMRSSYRHPARLLLAGLSSASFVSG